MLDKRMSERLDVIELLRRQGYERRQHPFRLSSGAWSHDYVDARRALAEGSALEVACRALLALAEERGVSFEAVGGLTMGADPLAHGIALVSGKRWFSVRKEAKGHGKRQRIEGARLSPGERVLLVDDVVTTGSSILSALEALEEVGARVALATALLDRGEETAARLADRGVPYHPLVTYRDLGIEPVVTHGPPLKDPSPPSR